MSTNAKRKANDKWNKKNQVNKTVPFYESTESDLIDWINNLDDTFANYVKELIRKDMKSHE